MDNFKLPASSFKASPFFKLFVFGALFLLVGFAFLGNAQKTEANCLEGGTCKKEYSCSARPCPVCFPDGQTDRGRNRYCVRTSCNNSGVCAGGTVYRCTPDDWPDDCRSRGERRRPICRGNSYGCTFDGNLARMKWKSGHFVFCNYSGQDLPFPEGSQINSADLIEYAGETQIKKTWVLENGNPKCSDRGYQSSGFNCWYDRNANNGGGEGGCTADFLSANKIAIGTDCKGWWQKDPRTTTIKVNLWRDGQYATCEDDYCVCSISVPSKTPTPTPPFTPTSTPTPTPTPTPTTPPSDGLEVFVSSTVYNGNLGGLSGADQKCQALANNAGLGGDFIAWLSTESIDAKDRVSDAPYFLIDGTQVAENKAGLLNRSSSNLLLHEINFDEQGNWYTQTGNDVWTGTQSDGTVHGSNCLNWTSYSTNDTGLTGLPQMRNNRWTAMSTNTCNLQYRLYCFEVSGIPPVDTGNLVFKFRPQGMINPPSLLEIVAGTRKSTGQDDFAIHTVRTDLFNGGTSDWYYEGKINGLETGDYEVIVKPPRHLSLKFDHVNVQENQDNLYDWRTGLAGRAFWAGDVGGENGYPNNEIDIYDIDMMIVDFDEEGLPGNLRSDADYDGKVTIHDVSYVIVNFDKEGEE